MREGILLLFLPIPWSLWRWRLSHVLCRKATVPGIDGQTLISTLSLRGEAGFTSFDEDANRFFPTTTV